MKTGYSILKDRRVRNAGVVAAIVVAHLGLFAVIGRGAPGGPLVLPPPPLDVILYRPPAPPPPEPPPPPPKPAAARGGGAPAAPSRIHTPPPPPQPQPDSPPAPVVQAPEQALVVGIAPTASSQPGFGQGGQGTGSGTGDGEGDGPGSGIGPLILRGASSREIFDDTPRDLRRRARGVDVTVSCEVRLDQQLTGCRVVRERPAGQGFGSVAIRIAERRFRVRPPRTAAGEEVAGGRIAIGILWP